MNEERWNTVRQFYMESFGIAPELVDLMASNEILLMSVSGSSNQSISRILNIDIDSIKEIISTIFDFDGWSTDLEFSPLHVYESDNSYIAFVGAVVELFGQDKITIEEINTMHRNCEIYESIANKLDKEWV
jgi:hypothetical protein